MLLCCCAVVLLCCCAVVLLCCCAVVLLCCCAVVLLCCAVVLVVGFRSLVLHLSNAAFVVSERSVDPTLDAYFEELLVFTPRENDMVGTGSIGNARCSRHRC